MRDVVGNFRCKSMNKTLGIVDSSTVNEWCGTQYDCGSPSNEPYPVNNAINNRDSCIYGPIPIQLDSKVLDRGWLFRIWWIGI